VAARAFRDAGLDVLFQNMAWYGSRIGVPTVAWIPDFQHRRLPRMFTPFSWAKRELGFQALTRWVDVIMLSSEDARGDCERYYPAARGRIRVVPFSVKCSERVLGADSNGVRLKYGLPEKFLFFPGQLYKHKNHLGMIDALRRLRQDGLRVVVAVSGDQRDGRNPGHINDIINTVRQHGLEDNFRLLGFVPYDDMLQLMRRSAAVVNASFCEGWSTTVEEAKALGVPLVLSNLDVHREQTGSTALFFDANSPASIATALQEAWSAPPGTRAQLERTANEAAARRRLHFARTFVDVARSARGQNQSTI
jgi:glycosyltransferase involved in cell wall biosynthesis